MKIACVDKKAQHNGITSNLTEKKVESVIQRVNGFMLFQTVDTVILLEFDFFLLMLQARFDLLLAFVAI